ncbi:MAG: DNA recombination/repair protein RecA [Chryseobacterium sp.]|nr:MAG: DNA recombination/repair protein RecA [Chryseobacterium sp.]
MARHKADNAVAASNVTESEDISKALIKHLNKEFGTRVAYNLSCDESPTHIKRWIHTGSHQLDYIISNRRNGGVPEGRIIEIAGPPSSGKSHIAFHMSKTVQDLGGIVVYIDSENAVPLEKLAEMGIDVKKRFLYCDTHCTEDVFKIAEAAILNASSLKNNVPILVVWDSVAATAPKEELNGDYDKLQMGLQARTIAKALRKITGLIATNNVTFLCLNQIKSKVGVIFGNPEFTPGGAAIPFHASVRIKLSTGKQIKVGDEVIGIEVTATIVKNKVARPFRKTTFNIIFGHGIIEHDHIFGVFAEAVAKNGTIAGKNNKQYVYDHSKSWRTFIVMQNGEIIFEKKYQKSDLPRLMSEPEFSNHVYDLMEQLYIVGNLDINDADDADEQETNALAAIDAEMSD